MTRERTGDAPLDLISRDLIKINFGILGCQCVGRCRGSRRNGDPALVAWVSSCLEDRFDTLERIVGLISQTVMNAPKL